MKYLVMPVKIVFYISVRNTATQYALAVLKIGIAGGLTASGVARVMKLGGGRTRAEGTRFLMGLQACSPTKFF